MDKARALEQTIRDSIPLSEAMQFAIQRLDLDRIEVSAPLSPNVNIHGTGFAGSIYSLAVLTGWALCTHILQELDVDAELVVAKAEIRYRAPVTGELRCRTRVESAPRESFIGDVRNRGKGVLELAIEVGERPEALLHATFCALSRQS